jgi:hypothetical protein
VIINGKPVLSYAIFKSCIALSFKKGKYYGAYKETNDLFFSALSFPNYLEMLLNC